MQFLSCSRRRAERTKGGERGERRKDNVHNSVNEITKSVPATHSELDGLVRTRIYMELMYSYKKWEYLALLVGKRGKNLLVWLKTSVIVINAITETFNKFYHV